MTAPSSKAIVRAMIYMALGVFGFCILDVLTKRLTADYGTWQIIFLSRLVTTITILTLVMRKHGSLKPMQSRFLKTHLMRSVLVIATTWSFFECLRYIDLADAVAIAFAAPLFITAMSGPILGEKVGWRRWSAVIIGFVGVVIAAQPSHNGIGYGVILALCAAATYAMLQLWLRPLSGREISHNIIFYSTLFSGLIALGPALTEWRWPDATGWLLFVLQGTCSTLAQSSMIRAFKVGEASLLAPFEYTALVWAGLFGYLFWGEIPTLQVIGGAVIIIAASIYIAHREAQKRNT